MGDKFVGQPKKQGDWLMLFSSCILVTLKFAAGRQVFCPSRAKLGLKDWAIIIPTYKLL
jgi:hypothetical protein